MIGLVCSGAHPLEAGENCCTRYLAVPPTSMPEGKFANWRNQIASAISSAFQAKGAALRHCPLQLEEYDAAGGAWVNEFIDKLSKATGGAPIGLSGEQLFASKMDYFVTSSASVSDRGISATVTLLDHQHGQTVKSGTYSGGGDITVFVRGLTPWVDATFNPLDDIIYDYERKPQLSRLTLEGSGQATVQAGETVTIRLSEIFDHQGRPSQNWQRVYVKVEKGRILNGREKGDYRVFEVGSGVVRVTYKAPDACRPDKDTITVYNTCYTSNNPDGSPMDVEPDKEIAKKAFDIVCDQWDVKITYTESVGGSYQMGKDQKITVSRNYSGTFKARVKLVKSDRRTATYESTDADVQISDNYSLNSTGGESGCAWNGGFNGEKGGRVPLPVRFRLNTHNHTYSVGLGKWEGGGTTYTLGGNLHGKPPCTGGWQQEVTSTELPRGWEKGLREKPESRTWSPGQTTFTFENSWDDAMTGIWPVSGATPPPHPSFMLPVAWRFTYAPQAFDPARYPGMKIKRSLSWNVTRPK